MNIKLRTNNTAIESLRLFALKKQVNNSRNENLKSDAFTDPNFIQYLLQHKGITLTNEIIDPTDAVTLKKLQEIEEIDVALKSIKSLKGIEYMVNLKRLLCYSNPLTTLDVSNCTI